MRKLDRVFRVFMFLGFFVFVFSFYKMDRSWHQYVQVRSRTIEVASAGTIGGSGSIGRPELHFDSLPATNIQIFNPKCLPNTTKNTSKESFQFVDYTH